MEGELELAGDEVVADGGSVLGKCSFGKSTAAATAAVAAGSAIEVDCSARLQPANAKPIIPISDAL
jgi:hypothetical protein